MKPRTLALLFIATLCLASSLFGQAIKERKDIPDQYKWDLTHIYKTDELWEADLEKLKSMIPKLKTFEGKISRSANDLLEYLKYSEEVDIKYDNLYGYSYLSNDQDTRVEKYAGYVTRMGDVGSQLSAARSWYEPEFVSIPKATFEKWFAENKELAVYRQYTDNILRSKNHTLTPAEERILSLVGPLADSPMRSNIALTETDMHYPHIKDDKGNDIELSYGRFRALMESPDREVRKNAALAIHNAYIEYKNTAAEHMAGNIAKDIFFARARGYNSALHASTDGENVDTMVYLNLISTVKKNSAALHKYVSLRKKVMGLDSIHLYDMDVPLFPETKMDIPYDESVKVIEKAMMPLGQKYHDDMMKGFNGGWIDVFETKGKQTGAYSGGTYLSHPYLKQNNNNTFDDMFTTAHEMGHSMQTFMSNREQPFVYHDYVTFVAEVASTYNEALLMDYLIKNEKDPKKKLYYINTYMDNIRGTVIRQTIFAEFELETHRAMERGEPLTPEFMTKLYKNMVKEYFGPELTLDDQYGYTWIFVPHFYYNFYVYKYATSFAASSALSQQLIAKKPKALEKFLHFLSAGSSKYPVDLLKDAGVDMSSPKPIEDTMKLYADLVNQWEKLLKQQGKLKG